jgi:hypothetical protein
LDFNLKLTMSQELLTKLNGSNKGIFNQFIDKYKQVNINIAWYPSAYKDFRALLYLSENFKNKNLQELKNTKCPDLYILTDYLPFEENFFQSDVLFEDQKTRIIILEKEWLPNLKPTGNIDLIQTIGDFEPNPTLGYRVIYAKVMVQSSTLGKFYAHLIYAITYNEHFFESLLKPLNVKLSHIIHVRYGGGLGGGGKATGGWLKHVLIFLKVEYFITDNHLTLQFGDHLFLKQVLKNKFNAGAYQIKLTPIKTIESSQWSNHGNVHWNMVSKFHLNELVDEIYKNWDTQYLESEHIENAAYVVAKAFLYLIQGDKYYNMHDFFSYTSDTKDETELETIKFGCEQIIQGLGFHHENPITGIGVARFYKLMKFFQFVPILRKTQYRFNNINKKGALDCITLEHKIDRRQITMYNFCSFI